MDFLIYATNNFFGRATDFFKHWYIDGWKNYSHFVISRLEEFDQTIAFRITLENIFQPLYQDRSVIGYLLGFIFRSLRLFFGGIFYAAIIIAAISIYLLWAAIPLYVIYKIINPLILVTSK